MTPEQREKLRTAAVSADNIIDDGKAMNYFQWLVTPSAVLSLIAQVEALTVPQGFVLMPTSPSEAVLQPYGWQRIEYARYRAMLAAAPTIPAIPGTKEGA